MIKIEFNIKEKKASAYDNNTEIGICEFLEKNDTWNIIHTYVSRDYQGQGLAKKLVNKVIEEAKINNKILVADCSYAKKVIDNAN